MIRPIYILISLVFLTSCTQNKKTLTPETPRKSSVAIQQETPVAVEPQYEAYVTNWAPYTQVRSFIKVFYTTSTTEALNNALELQALLKSLKEGVPPVALNTPPLKARINVLHSEGLRLADMTYISAITSDEVQLQVKKLLEAFGALNAKINTLLLQKTLEDRIEVKDSIR